MKNSELLSMWGMPDNTRLTPKQTSLRLPVHVAAKIAALCDMYPTKTRTEIIGDLLTSALSDIQNSFPKVKGEFDAPGPDGKNLFHDLGPGTRFRSLANKHYEELERELGNEDPVKLYSGLYVYEESDFD